MAESSNTPNLPQGPTRVEVTKFSDQEMFYGFQKELDAAVSGLSKILTNIDENTQGLPQAAAFYTEQGGLSTNASRHTAEDASTYGGVGARVGASVGGIILPPGVDAPPTPAPAGTSGGPSNPPATDQAPGMIMQHVQNAISSALTPLGQSQSLWPAMADRPSPGSPNYQTNDQGVQIDPSTQHPYDNLGVAAAKYGSQYALPAAIWSGVAPALSSAKQFLDPGALSQWGTQLGTPPSQDATNIGPLRLPFGSMWSGISDVASSAWTGLTTPGLSTGQVMQGKQNIADLGWTPDNPMYGQMSAGVNELTQAGGSRLGLNPDITELLDQSTRYGTTSLEGMVSTLKTIPDAANAAQVSWEQMASDMKTLGDLYNTQGGTVAAGVKFAKQWSLQTGMPGGVAEQALQNPFVQSYATMQTGLMPQLQGLMSPGERISSTYGAVNQMYSAMSGMSPTSAAVPGPGGFTSQVGGREQAIALAGQFTGLKPEVVRAMTNPKLSKGIQSGAALGDAFKSWQSESRQGGAAGQEAWSLKPTGKGKSLGDFIKQLQSARSVTGKKMFSQDDINSITGISKDTPGIRSEALKNLADQGVTSSSVGGHWNDPSTGGSGKWSPSGINGQWADPSTGGSGRWAPDPNSQTSSGQSVLQTAQGKAEIDRVIAQKQRDQVQALAHEGINQGNKAQAIMQNKSMGAAGGGTGITIDLTPAARKVIQFKGKPGQTKMEAGAGSATTNTGFNAPTYISPMAGPEGYNSG